MGIESAATSGLVARVRAILLRPKEEWRVIDAEQTDTMTLFRSYIAPLAAIFPVAQFIGLVVFGRPTLAGLERVDPVTALVGAIVTFVVSLVGVYLFAWVVDYLAPRFGGTRNMTQALKVVGYGATAGFVTGIFALVPLLGILGILGLWSVYTIYLGLPVLMKVPQERATAYTVTALVVAFVLTLAISAVIAAAFGTAYSLY